MWQSIMIVMPSTLPARLYKFRILSLVNFPLGAFVSNMCVTRYDFLRYYVKHRVISHPSQTDIRLCYVLPKIAPSSLPNFLGDAFSRFERITKKHGRYGNHLPFIRHSRISGITVFRVSSESKSPLTKLHCVGHIYYSSSLLSSNRIPARQRQSDSILIGCDGGGGGDRRESQFPERSRCNLRLKQRGGTTITDCIRSTERVIPGTGDAGIHRHIAVYTIVHTRVCMCVCTCVGGARVSV